MTETPTLQQTATVIADRLGEREAGPRSLIIRIVKELGTEYTLALLDEALQIEANGGMMLPDGSRRRTPGGVFFWLVKERLAQAGHKRVIVKLFGTWYGVGSVRSGSTPAPAAPAATWAERGAGLAALGDTKGAVTTVKVTIIGRPAKVVEQPGFTLLKMQHTGPLPSLPKGIPLPPKVPTTTYIVYIAAKQWRGVAESLKAPENALIIEGVQFYDAEYKAITVFATNTTTKLLQQAKRAAPPPKP